MLANLRHSILAKVLGLLLLMLLLCFPLGTIETLTQERGDSQREAADELARTYTSAQTLVGPLLVVPYTERWTETQRDAAGKPGGTVERSKPMAHLVFPDKLHIEGTLQPEERYRGIFRIPFYALDAKLTGNFPAFRPEDVAPTQNGGTLEFRTPFVVLQVSDLRGLSGSPALFLADTELRFAQRVPALGSAAPMVEGVHAPLAGAALEALRAGQALPFTLALGLVGHETLSIVPVAGETTAHLASPWAHPRFGGRFLAAERTVGDQGFDARWRISSLVTSAQEDLRTRMTKPADVARATQLPATAAEAAVVAQMLPSVAYPVAPVPNAAGAEQSFDVSLAQPLNVYAMSTRAGKYGALFIGLVLMAAFMFELFRAQRLHPVQYGLVGLSIALFFLLLLALSEKFAFWIAYALAAGASVALLSVYFGAALGGWRRGAGFGAYVAVLYGAMYGLLASESNALLLGALLIFAMLAGLMVATRKVDWYALGRPDAGLAPPAAG